MNFFSRVAQGFSFGRVSKQHSCYYKRSDNPVLGFLGDSLTHGTFGDDWVLGFANEFNVVNCAMNGNTSDDVLAVQLGELLATEPKIVSILIGTNDVLNLYPKIASMTGKNKEGKLSADHYFENLKKIITKLQEKKCHILVVSIPLLFQDLDSDLNKHVRDHNEKLKSLCESLKCTYIPFFEKMTEILSHFDKDTVKYSVKVADKEIEFQQNVSVKPICFEESSFANSVAGTFFGQFVWSGLGWNEIGYNKGLLFTFDGVHFTKNTSDLLFQMIKEEVSQIKI